MPQLQSVMANQPGVKTIGMTVNDNGTASFFAVMSKSNQDMTEKLAAKRAEKKAAEKAAAKKEAKKEQLENYNFSLRADSVQTPYEKSIGQSIDFKG